MKIGNIHKSYILSILGIIIFLTLVSALGWIGYDVTYLGIEDTPYYHNLSNNVSDPVAGQLFSVETGVGYDTLWNGNVINYSNISSWAYITNSTTGMFLINATSNSQTGNFTIHFKVGIGVGAIAPFNFSITPVNDAPNFTNLQNKSFNISSNFQYNISAYDEENDIPFTFNITFLNCTVAEWSDRDCNTAAGRILFNTSQYSANSTSINISFTPQRNDIGNYTINFTVTDFNNSISPYNASTSKIVIFQVNNINSAPYFRYVCDNERNASEDSQFNCYINATDIDEINNLTISANETWFKFNVSNSSNLAVRVNLSTDYNASFLANFTPNDLMVGNWSINLSIVDTGNPSRRNSTVINFFISNINDSVSLQNIPNLTVFTTSNYTIYVNASDDDLLVPDKNTYNENLTFSSNVSWVNVSKYQVISGTNITVARIQIYPNDGVNGNTTVNISVVDANNYSRDFKIFTVEVQSNNVPVWAGSINNNFSLTERTNFYVNLSQNVSDDDVLSFSYTNTSEFSSFSINVSTGVINFTPINEDVGYHLITISASDGKISASFDFNFTVYNVNQAPLIRTPLQGNNITINSVTSNMTTSEDSRSEIFLWVDDDDSKIPALQRAFYNESLNVTNLTINGPNSALFNFSKDSVVFPANLNRTQFSSRFTPNKTDVGNYIISINVSDASNSSSFITFNLTIFEVQHAPVLGNVSNYNVSILETFFIDFDSTDTEEGNETTPGSNLTYFINNLTQSGNFLTINSSNGIINVSMSQSLAGFWIFNVSINDSTNRFASKLFNLTVYDYPNITFPGLSAEFNLAENTSNIFNFTSIHTVGTILNDTLNYTIFIDGVLRNSTLGPGNGTNLSWLFTPNFSDSNCGKVMNLTLNVSNTKLSNYTTWNVTINNTNSPISFISSVNDLSGSGSVSVTLANHFSDSDSSDSCINQTIGFGYNLIPNSTSGAAISISIINLTAGVSPSLAFSASSAGSANYSIVAFEYTTNYSSSILRNISSNNFSVSITDPATTTVTTPVSGGGGGGSVSIKPVSLKLILPGPISTSKKSQIILPLRLENSGKVLLNDIKLFSSVVKNGILIKDVVSVFDIDSLPSLSPGESKNITLTVNVDTEELGIYEITVNATVRDPVYSDWGKIFLEIKETNATNEKIIFTEELIAENPECKEIQELVDEAKSYLLKGEKELAEKKILEAISACQQAISQKNNSKILAKLLGVSQRDLFNYLIISSVVAAVIGMLYYYYKRYNIRRSGGY